MIKLRTLFSILLLTFISPWVNAEKLEVNDVVLNYEIHGEGAPLILVHGGTGSIDSVRKLLKPLSLSFKVIAIDMREHGYSTLSEKALSYELEASDIIQLIKKLNLGKVHYVGHSDGGVAGLLVARSSPELISRLVVIGANYHHKGMTIESIESIKKITADSASWAHKNYLKHANTLEKFPEFIEEIKHLWMTSPTMQASDLNQIKSPTLVVAADRDFIKLSHTEDMFKNIPQAELFIVPGSEHSIRKMNIPLLVNVITEFLAKQK